MFRRQTKHLSFTLFTYPKPPSANGRTSNKWEKDAFTVDSGRPSTKVEKRSKMRLRSLVELAQSDTALDEMIDLALF